MAFFGWHISSFHFGMDAKLDYTQLLICYHVANPTIRIRGCLVYGWFRPGIGYLYIGSTTRGTRRIYKHQIIGTFAKIRWDDQLHIWNVEEEKELRKKEKELTEEFRPFYNTRLGCAVRGVFGYGNNRKSNMKLYRDFVFQ